MFAIELLDKRVCMREFLTRGTFDQFLLVEGTLVTDLGWAFDGKRRDGFYSAEEEEALGLTGLAFLPWGMVRPRVYGLIRGDHTPLSFRFVLELSPDVLPPEPDVSARLLTLSFREGRLTATGGLSRQGFSLDRGPEEAWERWLFSFFQKAGIAFEKG